MILDTNALSEIIDEKPLVEAVLKGHRVFVPSIVLGEVLAGLAVSKFRTIRETWLSHNINSDDVILDVTAHTARHYADIWNELRAMGRPIPQNDIWIAALAREHKMPIVSKDAHFDVVPGLKRLGW